MFVVSTRRVLSLRRILFSRVLPVSSKFSKFLNVFNWSSSNVYNCSASDHMKLVNVVEASRETTLCLAGAHALVRLDDGTIVGDPMEKTTLDALKWQLNGGTSSYIPLFTRFVI